MKAGNIFFRVDGNAEIGLGHLVRCIALANMLKHTFEIFFVCKYIPQQVIDEINCSQFQLLQIEDESTFLKKIVAPDVVVIDGYTFDVVYQTTIKSLGCKLVCIDDLHDKEFVADLIINHSPAILPHDYHAAVYTQFALGLNYVLLRPLFLQQAQKERSINNINAILICFGGSDPVNLTKRTLNVVLQTHRFKKIIVVTGAAYKFEAEIMAAVAENNTITYYKAIGEAEMLNLMLQADLAIVPASGILFEVMAAGCHIISGYFVDNQKVLYEKLYNAGAFVSAKNFEFTDIELALEEVLKLKKTPFKLIDGRSGENILRCFIHLSSSLRRAENTDCELIFNWANEASVRANAFNSKPISFDKHQKWFNKKMTDGKSYIFILMIAQINAGQIRFDISDEEATISYLIDKNYRALGLGTLLVKKGIEVMRKTNKARTLKALVKPANQASINIFLRLAFEQTVENNAEYGIINSFRLVL